MSYSNVLQNVMCMVNVQHNCRANKCSFSATRSIFQEREEFKNKAKDVVHINPDDIILNCAKMRDQRYVGIFKVEAASLDQISSIREGAEREISTRNQKSSTTEAFGASLDQPTQVYNEISADEMYNDEGGYDSD